MKTREVFARKTRPELADGVEERPRRHAEARPPALSVVVPCYNEEDGLSELHRRITDACEGLRAPYEIVLVNDGSSDGTWPAMSALAAADRRVVLVKLSRNYGHQVALSAGLQTCSGDRVLILDADLQDPPELVHEMMRAMDDGADVVYGRRRSREGEGPLKLVTAWLFYRLLNAFADVPVPRDTGDFRLISRRALEAFLAMPERRRFIRGMMSWVGFKQVPILYDRGSRYAGRTKYPLRKMLAFAADAVVSSSPRPLALTGYAGCVTVTTSLLIAGWGVTAAAMGRTVPAWVAWSALSCFLSGIHLLALGLTGAYVGRILDQCTARPLYIVERVVRGGADERVPGTHSIEPSRRIPASPAPPTVITRPACGRPGGMNTKRQGFTLIELLVVVAVITLLIGLLLPAVQSARESSRRAQCLNNFRQLGLALQSYHDIQGTFPIGRFGLYYTYPSIRSYLNRQTWVVATLPHLEQSQLYNAYNVKLAFIEPANSTSLLTSVATFLCPSDTDSLQEPDAPWARVKGNFAANWGNTHYFQDAKLSAPGAGDPFPGPVDSATFNGAPFMANRSLSLNAFRDGTSSTLLVGETVVGQNRVSDGDPVGASDHRGDLYNDDRNGTMFMTYTGPNSRVPDQMGDALYCGFGYEDNPPCNNASPAFNASRSRHPGGVHALFGDGHVRFVKDSVNLALWRAAGSPSNGEVLSDEDF